jgi:hypothetical protein
MDIQKMLRCEIKRRGLTPADVAYGTELPYSMVNEFIRGKREIGAGKASKIATYLGFEFGVSQLRRKAMTQYEALVKRLVSEGYHVDDESIELVSQFSSDLGVIEARWGDANWSEDDAEMADNFRRNLGYLESRGYSQWNEDDAEMAENFWRNIQWLENNGWNGWSEDDADAIAEFVQNLELIKQMGEEATPERMEEVAEFAKNLAATKKRR